MDKITISMPEAMSSYVRGRLESGQYGNVSEFFRDLIRRDQERQARAAAELGAMIDRAEASGVSGKSFRQAADDARLTQGEGAAPK